MSAVQLYKPYPHQRAVHDAISRHLSEHPPKTDGRQKTFTINAMRQVGKTTLAGNEFIRFACAMPKGESAYISPTFELARKMMADFSRALTGTPLLVGVNKNERAVSFFNGHVVRLLSAEQGDSVRGLNVSGVLILDELAYMRDSFLNEVVAPFTDFHKAPTIAISTPRGKRGRHFEYQALARSGDSRFVGFDWAKFDMSCLHSPEWLEEKRRTLPDRTFRTDYLGEFLDNEGSVFRNINKVILPSDYTPELRNLSWGIDWGGGSGNDDTVMTAYNDMSEQAFLRAWSDESPMQQVEEIASILNDHKSATASVVAEKNSIGAVYIDALRKKTSVGISEFIMTNESKRRIVESLIMAVEQVLVGLLSVEAQLAQFEYFESRTLPSGAITYAAPAALHDDYVIASALALSGRGIKNRIIIN